MKKLSLIFLLCGLTSLAKAQTTSVEKTVFGIQTGLIGIWAHNETRLTNQIALRSEIGFDAGFFGGSNKKTSFLFVPSITLEPRWYYNLNKRKSKSKNIENNSGNFVTLKTTFIPDWFLVSNDDDITVVNQLSIIPKWGMRRNIGKHFNYELGFGIGYRYLFYKSAGYAENDGEVAVDLHVRIGYKF